MEKELSLKHFGESWINGVACEVCKADIKIKNVGIFTDENIMIDKNVDFGCDVLIGMDIIADGDFRIRKRDSGEWVFTFNN